MCIIKQQGVSGVVEAMAGVFENYERQYCELSANLTKKCRAATLVDGGAPFSLSISICLSIYLSV